LASRYVKIKDKARMKTGIITPRMGAPIRAFDNNTFNIQLTFPGTCLLPMFLVIEISEHHS